MSSQPCNVAIWMRADAKNGATTRARARHVSAPRPLNTIRFSSVSVFAVQRIVCLSYGFGSIEMRRAAAGTDAMDFVETYP